MKNILDKMTKKWKEETFGRLVKVIKELEGVKKGAKIKEDSLFYEDLGMDSLERYEYNYAVEEEWGIRIPDEKLLELNTPKDYMNYIAEEECLKRR